MARRLRPRVQTLLIILALVVRARAAAVRAPRGPARAPRAWRWPQRQFPVHPLLGPVQPSQDIQDFVAELIRRDGETTQADPTSLGETMSPGERMPGIMTTPGNMTATGNLTSGNTTMTTMSTTILMTDSGENFKPVDKKVAAHIGYEQYWPGGEWVYRKAAVDRCNTSSDACSTIHKNFGPVCAGSHDLRAHHTFDTICDLMDTNCREGTVSLILRRDFVDDIQWWPVQRNGVIELKLSTLTAAYIVLARGKGLDFDSYQYLWPYYIIKYGIWSDYSNANTRVGLLAGTWSSKPVVSGWNETTGYLWFFNWYPNGTYGRGFNYFNLQRAFPVRYVALLGGNAKEPSWFQLTGYLMAYRGKCRGDLPTLPTAAPSNVKARHDMELYNFAERMDEFGYNFSRGSTQTELFKDHYDQ